MKLLGLKNLALQQHFATQLEFQTLMLYLIYLQVNVE